MISILNKQTQRNIAVFVMVAAMFFGVLTSTSAYNGRSVSVPDYDTANTYSGRSGGVSGYVTYDDLNQVEIMEKIQSLLSQVETLKKMLGEDSDYGSDSYSESSSSSGSSSDESYSFCERYSAGFSWDRNLTIGSVGEDVKKLQEFLNSNRDTKVADYGDGAPGFETNYFGPATAQALAKLQEKYRDRVLTPNNLSVGSGYFGPSSRSFFSSLYDQKCGPQATDAGDENPQSDNSSDDYADEDVSLEASPEEGDAPLLVVFKASHGDNSSYRPSVLDGRDTLIDFGDGSEKEWVRCTHADSFHGKCKVKKQILHVYTEAGTYKAKLVLGPTRGDSEDKVLATVEIVVEDKASDTTDSDSDSSTSVSSIKGILDDFGNLISTETEEEEDKTEKYIYDDYGKVISVEKDYSCLHGDKEYQEGEKRADSTFGVNYKCQEGKWVFDWSKTKVDDYGKVYGINYSEDHQTMINSLSQLQASLIEVRNSLK